MQRITNCILINNNKVLLLKKPSRGWYAIPGGKMEQGETIKEAAVREFKEETALNVRTPALAGVFTFSIFDKEIAVQEWMMFTFISHAYDGKLAEYCHEGELEWVPIEEISKLPMAAGDLKIFEHILASKAMLYGSFSYTTEYELLNVRLDPLNPERERNI